MRKHQAANDSLRDVDAMGASVHSRATKAWDAVIKTGEANGFRNAQASVLAPTGTIGLLMDCDTTGVEPDFALVKFKKLAGGGYFKIINGSIPPALARLGYTPRQIEEIVRYCRGSGTLKGCPHVNPESLRARGLPDDVLTRIDPLAVIGRGRLNKVPMEPWG
jgi:ribonucleoside-diphosphate reductase alpha chain